MVLFMALFANGLTSGALLSPPRSGRLQSVRGVAEQPGDAARACVPHWVLHNSVAIASQLPIESTTTRSHADVVHAKALCASDVHCVGVTRTGGASHWILGGDEDGRGGPRAAVFAPSPASTSWLKAVPFCLALPHRGGFLRNAGSGGRSVHHRLRPRDAFRPSASVAAVTRWLKKNNLEVFAPRFEREGVGGRELERRAAGLVDLVDVVEADQLQKERLVLHAHRDFQI